MPRLRRAPARYEGETKPASIETAMKHNIATQIEQQRDRCSVCHKKYDWFQLDGSGRGPECQP